MGTYINTGIAAVDKSFTELEAKLIDQVSNAFEDGAEVSAELHSAVDPEDTETVNEYYEHLGEISHRMETAERMVWMLWDIVHSINI